MRAANRLRPGDAGILALLLADRRQAAPTLAGLLGGLPHAAQPWMMRRLGHLSSLELVQVRRVRLQPEVWITEPGMIVVAAYSLDLTAHYRDINH